MAKLSQKMIQRALSKAKAQPKDKVSLKKAPWDKEETNEEEVLVNPKKASDKKSDVEGQEMQELTVNSADKKPQDYLGPDGKMHTRMVPAKKDVKEEEKSSMSKLGKYMADRAKKRKQMDEEVENTSVYARILEKRSEHYKSATAPQEMDDLDSPGAKKMRDDMKGETQSPEETSVADMDKAMKAGPSKKARPADKAEGDTKIVNPVKKMAEAYAKVKKEELTDKQKKIDHNKNGKIDGEDLAKLRNEEAEQIDEISKDEKKKYYDGFDSNGVTHLDAGRGHDEMHHHYKALDKKGKKGAAETAKHHADAASAHDKAHELIGKGHYNAAQGMARAAITSAKKAHAVAKKHFIGHTDGASAHDDSIRAQRAHSHLGEDVERIDEISKDLAGRYIKKANISTADAADQVARSAGQRRPIDQKAARDRGIDQFVKRKHGIDKAVDKLTGKARVPATNKDK